MSLQSGISFTSIQRILKLDLKLSKRCAKYVPRALTPAQTRTRVQICDFWSRLLANNQRVFETVVTVDESWLYLYDPESKEQSRQWLRCDEERPQKPQRGLWTGKTMIVTFFDSQGMIYFEFVRRPQTVNQQLFQNIIRRFHAALIVQRPHGAVQGCRFIHMDNASSHTADLTLRLLRQLQLTRLPHPPYSPDLAPNDFWLYPTMKKNLKGRTFPNLNALQQEAQREINNIPAEAYHNALLVKWPHRWAQCLACQGHYFEGMN